MFPCGWKSGVPGIASGEWALVSGPRFPRITAEVAHSRGTIMRALPAYRLPVVLLPVGDALKAAAQRARDSVERGRYSKKEQTS